MKIKKGDNVIVTTGKDKGKKGKVVRALPKEEKVVVIVSFLAMLELVRQGMLNAVQETDSEEIIIEMEKVKIQND